MDPLFADKNGNLGIPVVVAANLPLKSECNQCWRFCDEFFGNDFVACFHSMCEQ